MTSTALLTSSEVARRLGVKPATVYAYVSRGLLQRDPASRHRHSLFDAEAVERLAASSRRPNHSAALEVSIETALTYLDPAASRLSYRGHDVGELSRYRSFEDVAALLWDGPSPVPWELDASGVAQIAALAATVPDGASPFELIPLAVAALAVSDPDRADRRPEAVRGAGARIMAGVLALLNRGDEPGIRPEGQAGDRSAARRIWSAFSSQRPRPAQLGAVNAMLVSLADHELAASTFAARVAASTWADPYRVVLAGLGALGGSLHGGASLLVADMLEQVSSPAEAFATLERLSASGGVPGLGHRVYRDQDPRAVELLRRLEAVADDPSTVARVRALLEAREALGLPAPNVDFALAALLRAMGLAPEAAPTIFSFARIVGLLAHALEEYPHRLRFRPRATYVGPVPAG